MFTGLIEALGEVEDNVVGNDLARLTVRASWPADDSAVAIGDSVAVNGCCLTAVRVQRDQRHTTMTFELSHETLARTALGLARTGTRVNLERALRLGDRLGGHIVTGHVDGLGRLESITPNGEAFDVEWSLSSALEPELVQKGSVAVDGVSLTVNSLRPGHFQATIIPHTVEHTQLLVGGVGKPVHLETDVLAKHVRRLLAFAPGNPLSNT